MCKCPDAGKRPRRDIIVSTGGVEKSTEDNSELGRVEGWVGRLENGKRISGKQGAPTRRGQHERTGTKKS
jgi:hypothetical protein